jgi:hypothetical protein
MTSPVKMIVALILLATTLLAGMAAAGAFGPDWRTPANLKVLDATQPESEYVRKSLDQVGGLYFPDEPVNITLALPPHPHKSIDNGIIELMPVDTRSPEAGDTGNIGVVGAPTFSRTTGLKPLDVPVSRLAVHGDVLAGTLPLPDTIGTYALRLQRADGERTVLGTVARVFRPIPRPEDRLPRILADAGGFPLMYSNAANAQFVAQCLQRLGTRMIRWELHWAEPKPGTYDWAVTDGAFKAMSDCGIKVLTIMGTHPFWTMPFGQPPGQFAFCRFRGQIGDRLQGRLLWVYRKNFIPDLPFSGDVFQFAFDTDPSNQRMLHMHDLKYPVDALPAGYHAVPDTDYEFSAYLCNDGQPEVWCLMEPGMPRTEHYPRQPRGPKHQHAVKQAQARIVHENGKNVYRLTLPWSLLGIKNPSPGTNFGFTFRLGSSSGPPVEFGLDKAATKSNGLALHPYWDYHASCTVRWTLLP